MREYIDFAICGINGQLSESQKDLRALYPEKLIKRIKASEIIYKELKK